MIRAICIMWGIWKGAADEITHFPTIHESPEDKTYLAPNQWHDKVLQTIKSRRSPTTTEADVNGFMKRYEKTSGRVAVPGRNRRENQQPSVAWNADGTVSAIAPP